MQDGKPALPNRDIIKDCVGVEDLSRIPVKLVIGKTKHWLCKTCQGYMMRNRMPPMCQNNKLSINHEPKLERLTRLENSLIAREINFMFIHELPVSRMWCQKGKVTLVPIEDTKDYNSKLEQVNISELVNFWDLINFLRSLLFFEIPLNFLRSLYFLRSNWFFEIW